MTERPSDPWSIAIWRGASPLALEPSPPLLTRDDIGPSIRFVADPFLLQRGGVWHLFFEVLAARGEIGLATSRDTRSWRFEGIVLREPFHVSYPHVFTHRGEVFMTPETLGANAVRLYRADLFPHRWTHVADLLPGAIADPTPFALGDRWWMFGCPRPYAHDALALFGAGSLTGPWREHPRSPLIRGDRRGARPAGRVILIDGQPVRLAQDCVPWYGSAVRAFTVTTLTPDAYGERALTPDPLLAAGSGWNGLGMHHLDAQQLPDGSWIAAVDGHGCSS